MDDMITNSVNVCNDTTDADEQRQRDENRSPTSGSSSETAQEHGRGAEPAMRKHRRHSKSKRKRRWKPYTELSWDERRLQDDRETKRACAKRDRLSAEGHPIAPYNTTQFLMEDHKSDPANLKSRNARSQENSPNPSNSPSMLLMSSDKSRSDINSTVEQRPVFSVKVTAEETARRRPDNGDRDDIQKYILQDFSHTYAECHADELQSLSKSELVTECLKLEKKVDSLERKVKDCQRRHKDGSRNQADIRLLEKLNQLQSQNAVLMKDNAHHQSGQQ